MAKLFAGVVARSGGEIDPEQGRVISSSLSRSPGGVCEWTGPGAYVACLASNGEREGFRADGDRVSILAGDPLFDDGSRAHPESGSCEQQLGAFHAACRGSAESLLRSARGVFCGVSIDLESRAVTLVTDKLGIRPLYYCITPSTVAFSTAFRVLEALPGLPRVVDLRALVEQCAFGFPLADRTPFTDIKLPRGATILRILRDSMEARSYWDWNNIEPHDEPRRDSLEELHDVFREAIRLRLHGDTEAVAFLSGGLDSRVAVTMLVSLGIKARTVGFGWPGSQDDVLSRLYAARLGTEHHARSLPSGEDPSWSDMMARVFDEHRTEMSPTLARKRVAWSGDGGSVGLGCVYITPRVVECLEHSDDMAAVRRFLGPGYHGFPKRLLVPSLRNPLGNVASEGLLSELKRYPGTDRIRAFHLFLMSNDQRRHLVKHFEDLDRHGIELCLPFYDSRVMERILRFSSKPLLYHRLYAQWLHTFPTVTRDVPWQSYPGHVSSFTPPPPAAKWQWGRTASRRGRLRRWWRSLTLGAKLVVEPGVGHGILRRETLMAALGAHALLLGDYGYVIGAAERVHRYCRLSAGDYVLTAP